MAKRRRVPNRANRNNKPVGTNVRGAPGWGRSARVLPRPGGLGRRRGGRAVGTGGRR